MVRRTYRYIYKTTCLETSRYYIGKHTTHSLENEYFGSGKILKNSLLKYGAEKHVKQILALVETNEQLNALEEKLVDEALDDPLCMNIVRGGQGGGWELVHEIMRERGTLFTRGMLGKKHSDEAKAKMSNAKKGTKNNQFGKRAFIDPNTKEKIFALEKPDGYLTPVELRKTTLQKRGTFGKKWFNDGEKNYLFTEEDGLKRHLNVGRLNPGFK